MVWNWRLTVGMVLALLFPMPLLQAQPSPIDDLRKEIRELSETVKSMQKDLQDIKALLSIRKRVVPPGNVLLDLDDNPARGKRTAKLTLVEFSDYQ